MYLSSPRMWHLTTTQESRHLVSFYRCAIARLPIGLFMGKIYADKNIQHLRGALDFEHRPFQHQGAYGGYSASCRLSMLHIVLTNLL
jgi:hypothetical protein